MMHQIFEDLHFPSSTKYIFGPIKLLLKEKSKIAASSGLL